MSRSAFILAIFLAGLYPLGASLAQPTLETQRKIFLEAEQALKKGDTSRYNQLEKQLGSYPLKPYLERKKLQQRFNQVKNHEVKAFLKRHQGTPIADLLRWNWLNHLARKKHWRTYLQFYTPQKSVSRQCYQLHALINTGQAKKAWPKVQKLWLHGRSRPRACDPVFKAWENAGKRTTKLTWQRIELALEAGQWRLAQYLGKKLGNRDTVWLKRWIRVHRNPKNVLRHKDFRQQHPYRETMLAHAIQRMANIEPMEALKLWRNIEKRYAFTKAQIHKTERRIAIRLERNPTATAYWFLKQQKPTENEQRLRIAQLRAALLRQDWINVLQQLKKWPQKEQASERWQYWYARALMRNGQQNKAQIAFQRLAQQRSYYGFLAADQINSAYHLKHAPTPITQAQLGEVKGTPGIQRAVELHALKRDTQARREWIYTTKKFNREQLYAASVIAEEIDWHDQAIFTIAKTGYWDDLELRFPLRHHEWVAQQANQYRLDSAWIFAVIRQESAFMRDARSHAGAIGLMQLMPATARHVARDYLKRSAPRKQALFKAETNIELGSAYLRQLMDRFDNNPVLVTAAYNAGPHRVNSWLPEKSVPADIWVEMVPFKETSTYLRRVLSYTVIYDKRLGRIPKRLAQRMRQITTAH
jgi:soluble lytic murein transglycosylase